MGWFFLRAPDVQVTHLFPLPPPPTQERWIQGVLVVQVLFFLVVLWSRNRPGLQATLFFTAAAPIYLGSRINTFLAARWRTFAQQPYFDDSGIFYSAVIAAPLLCDLFTIVLVHVVHACADLAKMKRIQLAQRARELKKEHERGKKTEKKSEENVGAGEVAPRQGLRHRQRRA